MEVRGLLKHIREREDQLFLVLTLVIGAVVGARACCSNEIKLGLARSRGLYARVQVPPEEFFNCV